MNRMTRRASQLATLAILLAGFLAPRPADATLDYTRRQTQFQVLDDGLEAASGPSEGFFDSNAPLDESFGGSLSTGASVGTRFQSDSDGVRLDMNFELTETSGALANLNVTFTTQTDVYYSLEGALSSENGALREIRYSASLVQLFGPSGGLFQTAQRGIAPTGGAGFSAFALGDELPQTIDRTTGSLTGILPAGSTFILGVAIQAIQIGDQPTSGDAFFQFSTTPIPEPSTALLLGLGLSALAWKRSAPPTHRHL